MIGPFPKLRAKLARAEERSKALEKEIDDLKVELSRLARKEDLYALDRAAIRESDLAPLKAQAALPWYKRIEVLTPVITILAPLTVMIVGWAAQYWNNPVVLRTVHKALGTEVALSEALREDVGIPLDDLRQRGERRMADMLGHSMGKLISRPGNAAHDALLTTVQGRILFAREVELGPVTADYSGLFTTDPATGLPTRVEILPQDVENVQKAAIASAGSQTRTMVFGIAPDQKVDLHVALAAHRTDSTLMARLLSAQFTLADPGLTQADRDTLSQIAHSTGAALSVPFNAPDDLGDLLQISGYDATDITGKFTRTLDESFMFEGGITTFATYRAQNVILPGRAGREFPVNSLSLSLDSAHFDTVVQALIVITRSKS